MIGGRSDHMINIIINTIIKGKDRLFGLEKNYKNISKNLIGVQARMKNFGVTSESISKYQKIFNLESTKTGKSFRTMQGGLISNNNALQKYIGTHAGFRDVLRMNKEQYVKFNESGVKMNNIGGRIGNWVRNATHGLRGFKMEMLGVMFFGMALNRTFMGLLKTSMQWAGVTEVLSMAMGILFLPVAILLLDWALKFLDWVLKLSDKQKETIGFFVLVGAAVSGALMLFGMLALGIGSIVIAFGWLLGPIGLVVGALVLLAGLTFFGMFSSLNSELDSTGKKISTMGLSAESLNKLKEKIIVMVQKAWDYLKEKLPVWMEEGRKIMTKLMNGIVEKLPEIANVIRKLVETLTTFVVENIPNFIKIGVTIGEAIFKGIMDSFPSWLKPFLGAGTGAAAGAAIGSIIPGVGTGVGAVAGGIIGAGAGMESAMNDYVPGSSKVMNTALGPILPGGLSMTNNYNVTVSDRVMFETMLEENNRNLTQEVRKIVNV